MRRCAVLLGGFLLAANVWAARVTVIAGEDHLRVLAGPASAEAPVGRLADGAHGELLERRGEWTRIRYLGGEGWVPSRSIRPLSAGASGGSAEASDPSGKQTGDPEKQPGAGGNAGSGYLSQYEEEAELLSFNPGSSLISLLSGLLLVLALLAGFVYAARRVFGRRLFAARSGSGIRVLATRPLGPRHGLLLVEVGGLVWLLSQGAEGISLVAEIQDANALRRLNDRFEFLETPFESELSRQLDLEALGKDLSPAAGVGGERSPEERLAALRRGVELGD